MTDPFELIRRPEHVGENRCWPCTVANLGILAAIVVAVSLRRRLAEGAALAVAGVTVIALRGYLVPYTPRFGPRLAAGLPRDPFGHDEGGSLADTRSPDADRTNETSSEANETNRTGEAGTDGTVAPTGDEIVSELLEAGVVVPDGEDFVLDESFRSEWRAEIESLRSYSLEDLTVVADDLTARSVETRSERTWGRPYVLLDGPGGIVSLREPVAIAELAAARALESRIGTPEVRLAAGRPLRPFLHQCPRCDDELAVTRSSCCGEVTPIGSTPREKLVCRSCNINLFTYD